jgi:serine/threonine protein kinase/DNA-binding beta-propeller fold protein YncE
VSDEFPPAFSESAIGSQIAGYRLEGRIGRGGMAVVYRAYDPRLDRYVALKILAPGLALDDAFRQRFIRESRAAAAVDHPNIIPVFDAGEAAGVLFIAMRFVQGGDVRTLLDTEGRLPAPRAAGITSQVASALDAAHARGLVHRDVKPGNMLLDATAGGGRQDHVYLSDFGLSKQSLSQTGLTVQGQFLGTLDYVAPEQVEGRPVDGRADLYALACAAFELLAGAPPFKRDEGLAVVWAKLSEPPPPLSPRRGDLPAAIDDVMQRGMARAPGDRFGNCGEFATALREVLGLDSGPRSVPPAFRSPTEVAMPAVSSGAPPAAGAAALAGAAAEAGSAPSAGSSAPSAGSSAPPAGPSASAGPVAPAGPPTEAAPVSGPRSTRPGLTEPSLPVTSGDFVARPQDTAPRRDRGSAPPPGYRASADYPVPPDYRAAQSGPTPVRRVDAPRGAGTVVAPVPRPSWWRSRAVLAAAAVVVLLGAAGGIFAALHHANGTTSTGGGGGGGTGSVAAAVTAPPCGTRAATPKQVTGVRTGTTAVGGSPFGIAVTPDGRYSFVSTGDAVAVLNNHDGSPAPTQAAMVPAPGAKKTVTITHDGKYVLAAVSNGADVISATQAESGGAAGAMQGQITPPLEDTSNEVFVSSDDKLVFITYQNSGNVAVFSLQQAIAGHYRQAGFIGMIPLGQASMPQAMAESPDGRWLYVTGESQDGRLYLVDLAKAGTDPRHALVTSAPAGCAPARVIVSADGKYVWVTDRDSNALVAFSAARLLAKSPQPLAARVTVGQKPVGLSFVNGGSEIMVADANSGGPPGADNLVLVSTQLALHGKSGALSGFIPTGQQPRDLALEPDGKTLLSTDTKSGQLLAIDVRSLP